MDKRNTPLRTWTLNLSQYDYAKIFFISLSFVSMITTGIFAIPLVSNIITGKELDWNVEWTNVLFSITSLLGFIWGIMASNQFEHTVNLIRRTWSLALKLDPVIGKYHFAATNALDETRPLQQPQLTESKNPSKKKREIENIEIHSEGYQFMGLVDFWDIENEVPEWMDKGKYWKILLELQKFNKNISLKVIPDSYLPFKEGKGNLVLTIQDINQKQILEKNKAPIDSEIQDKIIILIPQWLVINTDYQRYNAFSQSEIDVLTLIISDLNKNISNIIEELIFIEKLVLKYGWNPLIVFLITFMNKSLPIRIIFNKTKELLPGAKKRQIRNTNENLSRISIESLIQSIMYKARLLGVEDQSLNKLYSLIEFLRNEYDKLGLGEGSSEYHNLHHSLEVAYMSIIMLPNQIHGYNFRNKDYEIMLVAALLHDYDPLQGIKHDIKKITRFPIVSNTISIIKRKKIHQAYFSLSNEDLLKYFRKTEPPFLPPKDFSTTHPEQLEGKEIRIESKIVEALIWRTDFPFVKNAYDNFKLLLTEIDNNNKQLVEKISLMAEILSLADLSVTYLSSDPLLAWDRVLKLYKELDFPTVEAVYRTDRFLSLFSEGSLFNEIISGKNFPDVFRQKWGNVYQFFHEGNPSNRINKIILDAKAKYRKVNMELEMTKCDFLINKALQFTNEFFIGIGKSKEQMRIAQSKLAGVQLENLEIIPSNVDNILPFLEKKSIDNFIITLNYEDNEDFDGKLQTLKKLIYSNNSKISDHGSIQIVIDDEKSIFKIQTILKEHKFKITSISNNIHLKIFPLSQDKTEDVHTTVRIITVKDSEEGN